ncbi:M12 family metallo-peptidase [Dyadobacter sandarakinus]|uniref:Por secretion system C-terminal sorting domain-containing protein n=1 Tax=Dyadobacter sandarakinus TaxID=2747268 RepID=A0ABX7I9B9_9BACT|nr:M12 family metallo-peptidase [Dyadobacter sandarakinus]QRR02704.1 hypothetical protein HWI92_18180 [Dyadobacter sandarakinus]
MMAKQILRINLPVLAIALLLCLVNVAWAQHQTFIQAINPQDIPSTQEVREYVTRLKRNPDLAAYYFIKLNPLASSQQDGVLQLDIPGRNRPVRAEVSHVEYYSDTEYEWIGKTDEDRGTVIVISKRGKVSAHISTPEGVYEILPAPSGMHCLHVIDPRVADDVGCATTSSDGKDHVNERIAADQVPQSGNQNAKLWPCQEVPTPRILVLYTPKALALVSSPAELASYADLSLAQFKSAIYNSGISSVAIPTIVGLAPINFVEDHNSLKDDILKLCTDPAAKNLRNQYQADLVIMYTDGMYGNGLARGASKTQTLKSDSSYSIVELWCTTSRKTFAHELGHLYGCRHDEDDSAQPTYAKGYNIKNGLGIVTDRTLMVAKNISDNQAQTRLLNFSNPNIQVSGRATGTANENNALRVSQSASIIAGFRPNPPPHPVAYVDGPTYVTSPGIKSYEVSYSCGVGSYSIVWDYSYDGVNYLASNITSDVFTWPFYQNQKIWLRATVSSGGLSVSAFISITAQMPSPYKTGNKAAIEQEGEDFIISPNPSAGNIAINYQLNVDADVSLEVLDHSRNVAATIQNSEMQHKGWHSKQWNSAQLSSGTYIIRLVKSGIATTQQILIAR